MVPVNQLVNSIIDAARQRAAELGSFNFDQAAIRIVVDPLSQAAAQWANTYDRQGRTDTYCGFVSTLKPDNKCTRTIHGNRNYIARTAMTLATCQHNVANGYGNTSYELRNADEPYLIPENGYLRARGCVSYLLRLERNEGHDHVATEDWARIYVAVDGGCDQDNHLCASTALAAISELFKFTAIIII